MYINGHVKFQLVDISKLGLNSKIKKFSYSFICGRAILPLWGRMAFCLQYEATSSLSVWFSLFCQPFCSFAWENTLDKFRPDMKSGIFRTALSASLVLIHACGAGT